MKRIPIEWSHFLEGLTDPGLSDAEHGLFDTVRDPRALPEERTRAARLLLEGMIRRRRLALISRFTEDGAETLLLFDPGRRARFRIRLPETRAGQERIPLPLMPADGEDPAYRDIQQLLTAQSNLIEYDRVLSPRELASRFQHLLTELLPGSKRSSSPSKYPPDRRGPRSSGSTSRWSAPSWKPRPASVPT
ncbi:MAG: hypothetical protein R3E12_06185 [Candidatus Eisenbacteria bacterium]